jgi:ArsR family transcriptional regulator
MTTAVLKPERLFRAVSDTTRLRILSLLLHGELCVCDLVKVLDVPQPTASRHLAYLRRAQLVKVRKDGVWCYYRLVEPGTELETSLRKCIECCSQAMPRLVKDSRLLMRRSHCCE